MNKLLIGLPVAVAVIFAGVPFMTGIVAEKKSKELVDIVNAQASQYGTVEMISYDRGFLSSDSSYKYSLAPTFQKMTNFENIEYDCQVDHGITGVEYTCLMAKNGAYQTFIDDFFGGKDPLSMSGNVSAFGGVDQTIKIDPLNVDLPDGQKVTISEQITFTTESDQSSSVYDFSGKVPGVLIEKNGSLNVENITFEGAVEELRDGLYVGDVKLTGKQIKLIDDKGSATLSEFSIVTTTKESGSTITSTMIMNAKNAEFPNQAGGTDAFTDIAIDVSMYGMDTDALAEYIKVTEDMQKSIIAAGNDKAAQTALSTMAEIVPVAEKLLQKGLGLNVKSSFNSGKEVNEVSLDLSLINEMKFNQMAGFLFSPDETLKNFKGSLSVDLKKELLEKYPPLAFAVAGVPFFIQTEEGVTLDVNLDSVLKVNGEETTVAQLQSLFR